MVGQADETYRARLTDSSKLPGRNRLDGRPAEHRSRTSFALLLLGLLGASLGCLLVVNTTLAANSIRINHLQQANQAGMQQVQQLRQQVAAAGSAAEIAKEARQLGMRPDPQLKIVDLHTRQIIVPGSGEMRHASTAHRRTGARRPSGPQVSGRRRQ